MAVDPGRCTHRERVEFLERAVCELCHEFIVLHGWKAGRSVWRLATKDDITHSDIKPANQ